ncbi:hypothetical protein ACN8ZM_40245 (plasmid) [Burkholderia aenigmatica]|uniref:hypothetical protein n=1 Tax=Burkholderia aenigmatica TaxID=2015348 RepID=UPI003B427933
MTNDESCEAPFYLGGKVCKSGVDLTHPNDHRMDSSAYLSAVVVRDHGVNDLLPDQIDIRIGGMAKASDSLQALQLRTLKFARQMLDETIKNMERSL